MWLRITYNSVLMTIRVSAEVWSKYNMSELVAVSSPIVLYLFCTVHVVEHNVFVEVGGNLCKIHLPPKFNSYTILALALFKYFRNFSYKTLITTLFTLGFIAPEG